MKRLLAATCMAVPAILTAAGALGELVRTGIAKWVKVLNAANIRERA